MTVITKYDPVAFPMECQPVAAVESRFVNTRRPPNTMRAKARMPWVLLEALNRPKHDRLHLLRLLAQPLLEFVRHADWRGAQLDYWPSVSQRTAAFASVPSKSTNWPASRSANAASSASCQR